MHTKQTVEQSKVMAYWPFPVDPPTTIKPTPRPDNYQLMRFYNVEDLYALIDAMEYHIKKLQKSEYSDSPFRITRI